VTPQIGFVESEHHELLHEKVPPPGELLSLTLPNIRSLREAVLWGK
jgi:hypothetical protein